MRVFVTIYVNVLLIPRYQAIKLLVYLLYATIRRYKMINSIRIMAKSELQKQNSKSNSLTVDFKDIAKAFCIKDNNKEKTQLSSALLTQVVMAGYNNNNQQEILDNTLVSINDIKPKDAVEAMLASQMVATHNAAMQNLARANGLLNSKVYKEIELGSKAFNVANKLTRTYTMKMEALQRYRGKGAQKMVIEHVNVNSGGQAIIGNIETDKKLH